MYVTIYPNPDIKNSKYIKLSKNQNILEGIDKIIHTIKELYEYDSDGYKSLIGNIFKRDKNGDIKYDFAIYRLGQEKIL